MQDAEKASKGGEISMSEKHSTNGGEIIVEVQSDETNEAKGSSSKASESSAPKQSKVDLRVSTESSRTIKPVPVGFPSPDISRGSPNPRHESLNRRTSFHRSFTKPKSRFGEPLTVVNDDGSLDQIGANSLYRNSFSGGSPNNISVVRVLSQRWATLDFEEIYKKRVNSSTVKHRKVNYKLFMEWLVFLCILGVLVASSTVEKIENYKVWGFEIWKWCVLVMVLFSGMFVTNWFMHFLVFVVESNFLLRKKVLYYVHGMKKSVQVFIWFALVLLTWLLLLNRGVERSKTSTKISDYFTWTLVSVLIGAFLWSLKTLLFKLLAAKFEVRTFYDRIQESLFHQYTLQTLSGPPLMEWTEKEGKSPIFGQLSLRTTKKDKAGKDKEIIDMNKLLNMKQEKVSAWTMKLLVDAVTSSGLSTISHTLDEMEGLNEQRDKEITSEVEATAAAYDIFLNVAPLGAQYIEEWDLLRFMIVEEVDRVWPLIDVANTGKVDKKTLTEWVVKCYNGRKALARTVTDTKTVLKQLDQFFISIVIVITFVVWLILVQIATTNIVFLISSQLLLAAFMFGNTCKNIFEAIVFIFVTHPFDVGDLILVDGVQLMVEEINVLNTVCVKLNYEKVYYPNSVLSTKPISNYYRSSNMRDNVEFSIDYTTPVKKIGELKAKVQEYVDENPMLWHPNHQVVVLEIEDVNKLKMELYFNHTMNFQEWGEKQKRRSEMVMALKKCFEELNIAYHPLP